MHRTEKKIELNDREKEILQWASEGKSDDVIADILNISQNTVRFHWKNIFAKLNANGRVFAVTKALRMELIEPLLIRPSYQKR
jgi:DNA-binding CsgD family transcriptional regulator